MYSDDEPRTVAEYDADRRRRELLKLEARFTRSGTLRALRALRVRR